MPFAYLDQSFGLSKSPRAYFPALRRYFQRRVPSEAVDDLVQDVFVSLQARKAASPIENEEAYLFTVARHVLVRYRQRSGRAANEMIANIEHICDGAPLPDRRLSDRQSLDQVIEVIATMPTRTRDIFLMHRFDGMTYAAIGRQFGVSTSAVEKHIMAALQILIKATGRGQ